MERCVLEPKTLASPRSEMVAFVESELAMGKTFPFLDQRSSGEEPGTTEKRTRYGSQSEGYEVIERRELVERGAVSWTTEQTEVVSFGPDDSSWMRLFYNERYLMLKVEGPEQRVAGIVRRFQAQFAEAASPELLASTTGGLSRSTLRTIRRHIGWELPSSTSAAWTKRSMLTAARS